MRKLTGVLSICGPEGKQGPLGIGFPEGGTAGLVLAKKSATDFDTEWITSSSVATVNSVNGKIGDVVLTYEDVGALSDETVVPEKTSDLTNDSGFITNSYHDATKLDLLTAGDNITISGNAISATDTTYMSGTGIDISGNQISVNSTIATKSELDLKSKVSVAPTGSSTNIVKYITVDSTQYKLPDSPDEYVKTASTNNNTLTITKGDATTINYEPSYVYEGSYSSSNPIATKSYVDGKISSALIFKGSCTYANLPTNPSVGDVWSVTDAHGTYPAGTNYAWNGTEWSPLGGSVDLSGYATTTQLTTGLNTKLNKLTAGSGIQIQNNVITNTVDSSTFATLELVQGKLSRYGDTLEGELVVKGALNPTITTDTNTGAFIVYGGKYEGAELRLNGTSNSTETTEYGGFLLKADNGQENTSLIGFPNAKLFWNNKDVLTSEGGFDIEHPITLSGSNRYIACNGNESNYLLLTGGTDTGSAYLGLCGKDRGGSDSGMFALHARNSEGHYILRGQPDGTLTWGGSAVAAIPTQITLTALHKQIDWTRANVYKVGRLVTVNISFRAKGTIAQSAYIYSGFPLPIDITGDEGMEVIVIFGSGYRKAKLWDDGRMQMSTGACSSGNVYTMNFSYVCQ